MMHLTNNTPNNSCFTLTGIHTFRDPWNRNTSDSQDSSLEAYTDADLAADLNALSFTERQAMEADIHGVKDIVEETAEFVDEQLAKMREALDKITTRQRQSWDRAIFLRPALARDRGLHLMMLRARRFRPDDAAILMAAYFQAKRDLFGDDLLIHRITWNDIRIALLFVGRIDARPMAYNISLTLHRSMRSLQRRNKPFSGQERIGYSGLTTGLDDASILFVWQNSTLRTTYTRWRDAFGIHNL